MQLSAIKPLIFEDNRSRLEAGGLSGSGCTCVQINIQLSGRRRGERITFIEQNRTYSLDMCPFLGQVLHPFVRNRVCSMAVWKDSTDLCG